MGAPMAPWPGTVDDTKLVTYVREHAQTAYHPVGTCRMGVSVHVGAVTGFVRGSWSGHSVSALLATLSDSADGRR